MIELAFCITAFHILALNCISVPSTNSKSDLRHPTAYRTCYPAHGMPVVHPDKSQCHLAAYRPRLQSPCRLVSPSSSWTALDVCLRLWLPAFDFGLAFGFWLGFWLGFLVFGFIERAERSGASKLFCFCFFMFFFHGTVFLFFLFDSDLI